MLPVPHLPLMQSTQMLRTLNALGMAAECVSAPGGQTLVLQRKLFGFGPIRFASRGPACQPGSTLPDQIAILRAARLHLINADAGGAAACQAAGFARLMTPATLAILRVAKDTDAQRAAARAKWRNAARQAWRNDLTLDYAPLGAQHRWLFDLDRQQQRKRGYRNLPPALIRAFANANPDQAHVFTASIGASPIAAMLILMHGPSATYHLGWSGPTGRKACAHHALLLAVTDWLRDRAIGTLELGTLDTQHAAGLARFKLGSGASPVTLGGTWVKSPLYR